MHSYWVVGASWGGVRPQDAKFIEQGIWMLGWEHGKQPDKASDMKPGDRIAIKRMKGKGKTGIKVLHLGVIKGVILEVNKVICTVNWVATDLDRNIAESRGCFQSIHGPFKHDKWVQEVFVSRLVSVDRPSSGTRPPVVTPVIPEAAEFGGPDVRELEPD